MPRDPSRARRIRWGSWVILAVGIAALAFGLYWVAFAINAEIVYDRNAAACTTVPHCGVGPPPVWAYIWGVSPFILVGTVVLVIGVVRLRDGRQARLVPSTA